METESCCHYFVWHCQLDLLRDSKPGHCTFCANRSLPVLLRFEYNFVAEHKQVLFVYEFFNLFLALAVSLIVALDELNVELTRFLSVISSIEVQIFRFGAHKLAPVLFNIWLTVCHNREEIALRSVILRIGC